MKDFLHVGTHKTGTKFLQHKVFKFLPKNEFIYNPEKLTQLICDLLKADQEDLESIRTEIIKEKKILKKSTIQKVLISKEIMSGDLFSGYNSFKETITRLHSVFKGVEILLFFRYQVDWIISCYRESVHEHHYQFIDEFLKINNDKAKKQDNNFVKLKYENLDYLKILKFYNKKFQSKNVHVFFYEDFKENITMVLNRVSNILLSKHKLYVSDIKSLPNRGYSAFSIYFSILRYRFLKKLGLEKLLIHRPIYFFGKKSIPAGVMNLSVLCKKKYWGEKFYRDNEEIRSANYPKLTFKEKLKYCFSFRYFIKNILDKIFYIDWDILKGNRKELEEYFYKKNIYFKQYLQRLGMVLPEKYISKKKNIKKIL